MNRITRLETQYVSVPEVAVFLGISERHAWSLLGKRELSSVRVGHIRRVSKAELRRYIQARTIPAKTK